MEAPVETSVSAGLAVFQGERFRYYAGVKRTANGVTIFLEQLRAREEKVVSTAEVTNPKTIRLRVIVHDAKCGSEYAVDDGQWKGLGSGLGATLLTTEVPGGFVGATVGMHVRMESGDKTISAD